MSDATLEHSTDVVHGVHDPARCAGRPCTIHNRSDHHMRAWPQHWRDDRGIMERLCPAHGTGHPDPDSPWPPESSNWIHGCCGCCHPPRDSRCRLAHCDEAAYAYVTADIAGTRREFGICEHHYEMIAPTDWLTFSAIGDRVQTAPAEEAGRD